MSVPEPVLDVAEDRYIDLEQEAPPWLTDVENFRWVRAAADPMFGGLPTPAANTAHTRHLKGLRAGATNIELLSGKHEAQADQGNGRSKRGAKMARILRLQICAAISLIALLAAGAFVLVELPYEERKGSS